MHSPPTGRASARASPRARGPWRKTVPATAASRASTGCRAESSTLEISLDVVRERPVEIRRDRSTTRIEPEWTLPRLRERYEPRNRLAGPRDDHFAARLDLLEQFG